MMTQDEYKRWANKMDGAMVLDANMKELVLRKQLDDAVTTLQTKLKRSRSGAKVALFWCDLR